MTAEQLLKEYVSACQKEPETFRELVTPYLCLSALYLKGDSKFLKAAKTTEPLASYKWIKTYLQILLDTFRPTVIRVEAVMLPPDGVRISSGSSVIRRQFDLSKS